MFPFELFLAFAITVVLPITVLKMMMDYKRQKLEVQRAEIEAQGGLTVGELKRVLREVVEEGNAPLAERIAAMEHELATRSGGEGELVSDSYDLDDDRTIGRQVATRQRA
jgi:hypothetical protein